MVAWLSGLYVLGGIVWLLCMEHRRSWRNWQLVVTLTVFLPHTLLWAASLLIALGVVKLLRWLVQEV